MDSSSLKGSQLGKLVISSGILDISWSRISELHESTYPSKDSALGIKIYQEAKCTVAVFAAPPICRNSSFNSASTLLSGSQDQNPFHFLCTENISSFSLHTPAFQLFSSAYKELSELKSELLLLLESKKPVIITGAALGGSVASLFTLWLLGTIDTRIRRPLCITFGSPLLGDASLQEILENSVRESCFLHVADAAQTPITAGFFKPFGTFLICFDSQCICIDDPEAVMELLFCVNADLVDWRDYGEILHRLDQSMLSVADSRPISMSDDVINRMEERAAKEKLRFDLIERLSDMKISMMYIEAFKKISEKDKIGYYDQFKIKTASSFSPLDIDVVKLKEKLNDFWKSVVEEEEKRPQSEMSILKRRFLLAGNNYRRMIEPLDIAEYYLSGRKDYRTSGRSHHYVTLEKWFEESRVPVRCETRDLSNLLTFDSCFWAEVEEPMIVINLLKTQEGMGDEVLTRKLVRFEDYVLGLIGKREVSPEIFLEKSSFMRWWKEYKEIRGRDGFDASPSRLTEFMNTGIHYSGYASSFLNLEDRQKGFVDEEGGEKVMKVHLRKDKEKTKALSTVSQRQSSEVSSEGEVGASKKIEPKEESSKHQHKKSKVEMMSKKRKKKREQS